MTAAARFQEHEDDDISQWPMTLQRLAEILGTGPALALAGTFGGLEKVYVPRIASPDCQLARVIGVDGLRKLIEAEPSYGGRFLYIPAGKYRRLAKARILAAKGSSAEIARRLGVSQRYVKQVRNTAREDRQMSLFEEGAKEDVKGNGRAQQH
ncbi:MAG: hypothetical protein ACLFWF_10920 [Alphaproteobacteria bacterium]